MPVKEIGDPRLQALFGTTDPRDVSARPVVRLRGTGVPPIAIAFGALVLAVLLFLVLNGRRTQQQAPSTRAEASDNSGSAWAVPPPLYVPPAPGPVAVPQALEEQRPAPSALPMPQPAPEQRTLVASPPVVQSVPQLAPAPAPAPTSIPPQHVSAGSPLVIDTGTAEANPAAAGLSRGAISESSGTSTHGIVRMRASAFANRAMTVPQGYLIPAVLETGFDSTKPGFARAIVSRDVRGFDGTTVLIPRGSRLVGEYKSAAGQGQNRAIINWTRLIRPDGMTIAMDAPAVDTVGRGGVAASVNSHFFARLGDALLQSTFAIGQALAGRAVAGPVVVVAGNSAIPTPQVTAQQSNYVPTLKVPPGKSISVFVAQDLDFSAPSTGK